MYFQRNPAVRLAAEPVPSYQMQFKRFARFGIVWHLYTPAHQQLIAEGNAHPLTAAAAGRKWHAWHILKPCSEMRLWVARRPRF